MTAPKLLSIDDDPEFFHGLTMWGDEWSAQLRDSGEVFYFSQGDGTGGTEYEVSADDARKLRDLLNVATARGML